MRKKTINEVITEIMKLKGRRKLHSALNGALEPEGGIEIHEILNMVYDVPKAKCRRLCMQIEKREYEKILDNHLKMIEGEG